MLRDAETALANFTAKNKMIVTPGLRSEMDRLDRNVKVQEEVYITIKKQLELAKIEEQEKKPAIEIIEKATPPLHKSSPKTKRYIILAFFVSLFLFVGLAFILEYSSKMDEEDEKYREFKKHLLDIKADILSIVHIFSKRKRIPEDP